VHHAHLLFGTVEERKDLTCLLLEIAAFFGDMEPLVLTDEERHPKLLFELLELACQMGLRHMQVMSCLRDILAFGDIQKIE
jgi:hypothetical protein